jgi:hypothetical protein
MIRTVTAFCIAALFGAGATLWAKPNPQQEKSSNPQNVKVTGCVGKDDKGVFTLTNSKVEPAGTGTLPDSLQAVATFQLEGSGLDAHISHKVEIDGSAVAPPPRPAETTTATAEAPRRATPSPPTKLTVKAVKHIHTYPCF